MPMTRPPYSSGFREQMVELVRSGRSPEELAREFEPSAQSIRNWVGQADRDEGRSHDGLTSAEREELRQRRTVAALPLDITPCRVPVGLRNPPVLCAVAKHCEPAVRGLSRRPARVPPHRGLAALGARATEDAVVLAMLDLPLDQHPPEVGAMKVAARCDNRTPAVLAPAVAPKPETGLAGPPNGLQHYSLKMLALSTRRDGPDCVLLLVSEALRHRQVALVDEIKHPYRARAPADAVPLRSRRHARMRLTLPRIHTNDSVGNFTP